MRTTTKEAVTVALRAAMKRGYTVRIRRRHLDDPHCYTDGFVVGLSPDWVLLHFIDEQMVELDGHRIMRTSDISTMAAPGPRDAFTRRALALLADVPEPLPELDLSDLTSILSTLHDLTVLLVVHRERLMRDTVLVGEVKHVSQRSFGLAEIDPDAEWCGERRVRFADVTMIDFDGAYECALALVAGLLEPVHLST